MPFSDLSYNLRIELDTKNCSCTPDEIAKMERTLDSLGKVVRDFPVSDLYITIHFHPPSQDYHVKTSLILSGKTLFTGDRDEAKLPAYERCVRKLVGKVTAYKERMSADPPNAKRTAQTQHEVVPTGVPDLAILERAVDEYDYAAFREAMLPYESSLRTRIGRWVQRYPRIDAEIGHSLMIDDIQEEVFLNAFEGYRNRPANVSLAEWLENLIDPSLKLLLANPDEELQNINMVRAAQEGPR